MTEEERRELAVKYGAVRCDEPFCGGRVRPVYRAGSEPGDVEPGGYCSRCGHEAY